MGSKIQGTEEARKKLREAWPDLGPWRPMKVELSHRLCILNEGAAQGLRHPEHRRERKEAVVSDQGTSPRTPQMSWGCHDRLGGAKAEGTVPPPASGR